MHRSKGKLHNLSKHHMPKFAKCKLYFFLKQAPAELEEDATFKTKSDKVLSFYS